jgi:hypothetical protein
MPDKTEYDVVESQQFSWLVLDVVDMQTAEYHGNCLWVTKLIVLTKELVCWNIFQKWNIIKAFETKF